MPAPGDQHKQPKGTAAQNPFQEQEQKLHISPYTAQEIATLSSRLNKRLGPEYISTRAGPGNSKVAYLSAEKAITLANEVFGPNGWSSSIQNIQIDFVDENATKGTISIGLSVVVRVTIKGGAYHEDIGYGGIENCKSKITAFEKAKKEGTTDGLKRALRNFGNVLGNCIYDKDYITKVSKVKVGTGRWDVSDLYRHQDFVVKKEEPVLQPISNIKAQDPPSLVPEDSFDVNDFDDGELLALDRPDEVMLPPNGAHQHQKAPQQASRPPTNHHITPSKPPQGKANNPPAQHQSVQANGRPQPHLRPNVSRTTEPDFLPTSRSSSPGVSSQHFDAAPLPPPNGTQSVGFFSAKAAKDMDGNNDPTSLPTAPKFNPYADSPSIRKTSGIDHNKSVPLNRNTLKPEPYVPPEEKEGEAQQRPTAEPRRAPAPGGFSPVSAGKVGGSLTSAYRPPTRHGPVNGAGNPAAPTSGDRAAVKRPPLSDLSNVKQSPTTNNTEGNDSKRQRIGPGLSGNTENALAPG